MRDEGVLRWVGHVDSSKERESGPKRTIEFGGVAKRKAIAGFAIALVAPSCDNTQEWSEEFRVVFSRRVEEVDGNDFMPRCCFGFGVHKRDRLL